jgi:hypothetical protein
MVFVARILALPEAARACPRTILKTVNIIKSFTKS